MNRDGTITLTEWAARAGISKQILSWHIGQLESVVGLHWLAGKKSETTEVYAESARARWAALTPEERRARRAGKVAQSSSNDQKFDTLGGGVNTTTKFISASELSREIGCSVGRILNAVETGVIVAAGKAGNSKNAAVVFLREDIANIKSMLEAVGTAPRPAHHCRNTSEVLEKAAALNRARQK